MYKILLISVLLFISCNSNQKDMKKIDNIWDKLTQSKSESDEEKYIAELHEYVRDEKMSFEIFFKDSKGENKDLQQKKESDTIKSVSIRFYKNDKDYITKENWKPLNTENSYYLYNE